MLAGWEMVIIIVIDGCAALANGERQEDGPQRSMEIGEESRGVHVL